MTLPETAVCATLQASCPYKSDHRPYLIRIDLIFMYLVVLESV